MLLVCLFNVLNALLATKSFDLNLLCAKVEYCLTSNGRLPHVVLSRLVGLRGGGRVAAVPAAC